MKGEEAVDAFRMSLQASREDQRYDLICPDIMMPSMDGHAVLEEIRKMEDASGIRGLEGVKAIMTTALGETGVLARLKAAMEKHV